MMKTTLAAIAALLVAGALPLAASAQTQDAPIHIDNVHIYQQESPDDQQSLPPGFADVAFTNRSSQPATKVEFALVSDDGAVLGRHTDVGSFASGVTIRHQFPDEDTLDERQSVIVAAVTFADGSTWSNPDLAPAAGTAPAYF